jgi:hypothetical protein
MTVTHKGQKLSKVDRSKHKKKALHNGRLIDKDKLDAAKNGKAAEPTVPKQPTLPAPGMAPSMFPEVNEAGQKLALAIETAKSASKARKLARDVLIQKMKARGQSRYSDRSNGVVIEVEDVAKVKLKKLDDGSRKGRSKRHPSYR